MTLQFIGLALDGKVAMFTNNNGDMFELREADGGICMGLFQTAEGGEFFKKMRLRYRFRKGMTIDQMIFNWKKVSR